VEALVDYEKNPGAGGLLPALPEFGEKETILNPYSYKIGGKDVLSDQLVAAPIL
jgi:hypothetical protein